MNATEVKKLAGEFGADLIGIASVNQLDHLPMQNHPRTIMPNAKSVIVVGHRIMRGTLRGVEEGTNFGSTYHCYGFGWVEDQFLNRTLVRLVEKLEDEGIEAVPVMSYSVENETFFPDYKEFAKAAGLGAVGKGGFFLTPEYGHRQRFAIILTDAEFESDKPQELSLCEGCSACLELCPLQAMKDTGGAEFEINYNICAQCKNGAIPASGRSDKVDRYAALCGRTCMVALEDKVNNKFDNKFRKRSIWSIAWENEKLAEAAHKQEEK